MAKSLFDLSGKTALVTGAAGGLGSRFAQVLSSAGASLILTDQVPENLQKLTQQLQQDGTSVTSFAMDITEPSVVNTNIAQLLHQGHQVDILINAAGISKSTPIFDLSLQPDFAEVIKTNLLGVWYVTQAIANHMKANKIEGSIINIASINGLNKLAPEIAAYCASKAGVIQMTKALVAELAEFNIRINCIAPGLFHTERADKLREGFDQAQIDHLVPLRYVADPKDLDGIILYLASNAASGYVTGSCITVDGGISWGG